MKTFHKKLTNDPAVNNFYDTFKAIEPSFAKVKKQIAEGTLKIQKDPDTKGEVEKFRSTVRLQLSKLEGVAKASLSYHRAHKDDGGSNLSSESLEKLVYIQKTVKAELSDIDFAIEQAQNCFLFDALANGQLPE